MADIQRALKTLDMMIEKIPDDVPTFRGILIDEFDRKSIIKICRLFANEWHKAQNRHHDCLERMF